MYWGARPVSLDRNYGVFVDQISSISTNSKAAFTRADANILGPAAEDITLIQVRLGIEGMQILSAGGLAARQSALPEHREDSHDHDADTRAGRRAREQMCLFLGSCSQYLSWPVMN
jgi:hypothetical protein